ncbi:hypothetical protein [Hyalangium versicolor]|nr:hypothetical protein [Hyalangium versicolor]
MSRHTLEEFIQQTSQKDQQQGVLEAGWRRESGLACDAHCEGRRLPLVI